MGKISQSTQKKWVPDLNQGKLKAAKSKELGFVCHMLCPRHSEALSAHCPCSQKATGNNPRYR